MKASSCNIPPVSPEAVPKGHQSEGDKQRNFRRQSVHLILVSGDTLYASTSASDTMARGPLRVVNPSSSVYSQDGLEDIKPADKGKQPAHAAPALDPTKPVAYVDQEERPLTFGRFSWPSAEEALDTASGKVLIAKQFKLQQQQAPPKPKLLKAKPVAAVKAAAHVPGPMIPGTSNDRWHNQSSVTQRKRHPSEEYVGFRGIEPQIMRLLTEDLWKHRPVSDFEIQKLPGGSYNRIVAIKVAKPARASPSKLDKIKRRATFMAGKLPEGELDRYSKFVTTYDSGEYILRIPRLYRSTRAKYDFVADEMIHEFVMDLGIACPKIVTYAEKYNGTTPWPYLLQEKIPGMSLFDVYPRLNQKQKLQLAAQIGTICKKMTAERYPFYGRLASLGRPEGGANGTPITRSKGFIEPEFARGVSAQAPVHRILQEGLLHYAQKQNDRCILDPIPPWVVTPPWTDLVRITGELDKLGAFGSEGWYFTHGDFYPRNIMADVDSDGNAIITAVLDWDMATFQPAVVACRPPTWLWQWEFYCRSGGDEDNLDIIATNPCYSQDEADIKAAFEKAAGEEYCKNAFHPYAYTARKFALWAEKGNDKYLGSAWVNWVNWFVGNWQTFEERIRANGFPRDAHHYVLRPLILQPQGPARK